MKILKRITIIVTIGCMLAIWPGCIILRDTENRSGDESHAFCEPLEIGESVSQSFQPDENRTEAVDFVLTYQEAQPLEGELLFEFLNDKGEVLQQETLQYQWIGNYQYFSIHIDKWLSTSKVYQYRLTNSNITDNQPRFVYTTNPQMYSGMGRGMQIKGVDQEGELLSRYHWKEALPFWSIVGLWGLLGMAGSAAWELENYIAGKNLREGWRNGENKKAVG